MNTTNSLSNTSLLYNRGGYSIKNDAVAISANRFQMLKSALIKLMLVIAIVVGGKVALGETTGTIVFGSASGSTNVNSASVSGSDSQGNTWAITTVGTTSFTPNASYSQIGSKNAAATSITFTTTLPNYVNITSMSADFGGFSGTAGTINLIVGNTSIGTGYLNGNSDVTIESNTSAVGTALTVTVTGISKGVKVYSISYTYETISGTPYTVSFNAGTGTSVSNLLEEYAGAGVVLPLATAPTGCDPAYSFYGWSTESVSNLTTDPTTIVGSNGDRYYPTSNVTLYAVYRQGTAMYQLVDDLSSVTAGRYYLLTPDNYRAFNGTISSGHGQSTDASFSFIGGYATTVPSGAVELILTASGDGYTMYNSDYGYLYAQAASSGKLAWHETESSYWSYSSNNWKYDDNNAFLRTYNNTFRTYSTSSNGVLKMAKKTGFTYNTRPSCDVSCNMPTTNVVSNIGQNTAVLSWTAGGEEPSWEYYYSENNVAPTSTTIPSGSSNSETKEITGLSVYTTYYWWVRAVCNGNDKSDWASGLSFRTLNYTLTATCDETLGSISVYGYVITAVPNECSKYGSPAYTIEGTADVSKNGNIFTVTPESNCTVRINFVEKEIYTVNWYVNGDILSNYTKEYCEGATIANADVPDNPAVPSLCGEKVFMGWAEEEFEEIDDPSATIRTKAQIGNIVAVNNDINYYAVFAQNSGESVVYRKVTRDTADWSGKYLIAHDEETFMNGELSGSTIGGQNQSVDPGTELSGTTVTGTWGDAHCLEIIAVTDGYVLKTLTNDYIYRPGSSSGLNYTTNIETATTNKLSIDFWSENNIRISCGVNVLQYNLSGFFRFYKNGGQENIYMYRRSGGGSSYSAYTTFCPCVFDTDGITGDNNYIWSGKNTGAVWESASNWVFYNSSETKYHLAANEPASSTKVFIIKNDDCNIVTPTVSEDATCGNLTMKNGLGIDIAENKTLTINGTATFTNGVINGNVTFGSGATVSDASASSHVDGVVTKSGAANGFTFPTGSNGNLGKVVVTDGSATNVSVQYFSNPAGFSTNDLPRWWNAADMSGENPFNHVSNVEYWKISSTEAITADFVAEASTDMHFNSETAEEDRIPANIQMAFYDNYRWTNVGGSASIDGNTLSINGAEIPASATRGISGNYTTFGSKSKSTVLPIELVSFTANCNGRSALIEWTTATEKNNDFFVLERSHDAVNFKEIARIAGAGNSIEPISYAYTDFGVRNGDNYYRLVQFDYDGTSTASEIIVANCLGTDGEPEVLAYPNPFGDDLMLRFENFGNIQATVEVYDMLGRMVHTQKVNCSQNDYVVVLRLAGLSDGTYNVRINAKEFVLNKKVVKQ